MQELANKRTEAEKTLKSLNWSDYQALAAEAQAKGYKLNQLASYLVKKQMGWVK